MSDLAGVHIPAGEAPRQGMQHNYKGGRQEERPITSTTGEET